MIILVHIRIGKSEVSNRENQKPANLLLANKQPLNQMKTFLQILALAMLPALASGAPASLSILQNSAGQKAVFDSVNNEMWYWDLSTFANETYAQQLAGIQQLNVNSYFGLTDWHLASTVEMQPLWELSSDTIRSDFNPTQVRYEGSYEWHYWSGRFESGSGGVHQASDTAWGNFVFGPWDFAWPQIVNLADSGGYSDYGGAWVVSPVPEPQIAALLSSGSAMILFLYQRRKRICK